MSTTVQFEYGWDLAQWEAELARFDHIVVATGATYRGAMNGLLNRLLSAGVFRARSGLLRVAAAAPRR